MTIKKIFYDEKQSLPSILARGTGIGSSVNELIKLCSEILGIEPKTKYVLQVKGEILDYVADTTKLKRLFGRKTSTLLRERLKHTFKWLERNI